MLYQLVEKNLLWIGIRLFLITLTLQGLFKKKGLITLWRTKVEQGIFSISTTKL